MRTALKASTITTVVAGVLAALLLGLLVLLIFQNKDLLRKETNQEENDDRYKKMKANPNIDDDSEIGASLVRNAINKQTVVSQEGTEKQAKISSKSLMI